MIPVEADASVRAAVDGVLRARRATRGFLARPMPADLVCDILDVARWAPSNSNIQPWCVHVLAGPAKAALSAAIGAAHRDDPAAHVPAYKHFPDVLDTPFADRQREFGRLYYDSLGIAQTDAGARHAQTGRNFAFFDAPVGLVFTIADRLERGSWLDYGIFLQSVMVAARARGLDTCPQISFVKYHAIIRAALPVPADHMIVCGMSLGYADPATRGSDLAMPREPVERFATFHGFEGDPVTAGG
jgi:nitroreductase